MSICLPCVIGRGACVCHTLIELPLYQKVAAGIAKFAFDDQAEYVGKLRGPAPILDDAEIQFIGDSYYKIRMAQIARKRRARLRIKEAMEKPRCRNCKHCKGDCHDRKS
jgi:hypothetical protein